MNTSSVLRLALTCLVVTYVVSGFRRTVYAQPAINPEAI